MWTAKLKYWHENSIPIEFAKKFNVIIFAFLLNTYEENGLFYMTTGHLIKGEKENREKFFKEIVKVKRLKNVEIEGDFLVYTNVAPVNETHMQLYVTPNIFLTKPIETKPDGFQYMEVASWSKENLAEFIKMASKKLHVELSQIKKEKITDFYVPHIMPALTEKQKKIILMAYENGYYNYPKKTNIDRLSRQLKQGASTVQEHLRKAEQKLLTYLLENMVK